MPDPNQQTPSTSNVTPPAFSLDFLCKLIPTGFDGNRYELGQFIANSNNANHLCSESRKLSLLYFILAKIIGRAKEQLNTEQEINSWDDLKNKLRNIYQDRKHYVQLMEELNNCRQNHNES